MARTQGSHPCNTGPIPVRGTKLAPIFKTPATPKKTLLVFLICARPIFSENEKDIFLFGVLPVKIFRQCGGAKCGRGKAKQFSGESLPAVRQGFAKTSADFWFFAEEYSHNIKTPQRIFVGF